MLYDLAETALQEANVFNPLKRFAMGGTQASQLLLLLPDPALHCLHLHDRKEMFLSNSSSVQLVSGFSPVHLDSLQMYRCGSHCNDYSIMKTRYSGRTLEHNKTITQCDKSELCKTNLGLYLGNFLFLFAVELHITVGLQQEVLVLLDKPLLHFPYLFFSCITMI